MTQHIQLRQNGLFDARVPRYTSYPPANHFNGAVGAAEQASWLEAVPEGAEVSLYLHIPFCKRLCWFCACRTQGTQTMRPVESYNGTLMREIGLVRAHLPKNVSLSRLHLGGGTPTILTPSMMGLLLDKVFGSFTAGDGFEFSVEIDPTEVSKDLLDTLVSYGINRASIGVQDFDPRVQAAIGRVQSYAQTHAAVAHLRNANVRSLNMDLLYGLPHQTSISLSRSLRQVLALQPDRLALYGYAHVPWMSKRQVMIDGGALPDAAARFDLSQRARALLIADGFTPIGIDHFARPSDSLSHAKADGRLRRNFQGYTDDTAEVLIGLGASAISKYPQGYCQNAPATAAYAAAVADGALAGSRGHVMVGSDTWVANAIEQLMCDFRIDHARLAAKYPSHAEEIGHIVTGLDDAFPDAILKGEGTMTLRPGFEPLARIVAGKLDGFSSASVAHSSAV
jgi:oxygen-independent coproporphyrinogen-3 oxidase